MADQQYNNDTNDCHRIWVCKNAPPLWTTRLAKYGYPGREGSAASRQAAAIAYIAEHPPCGCVITAVGRDAEIVDYHTILDLLIRDGEQIKHHLLETNENVYQRGLEVLYSSEITDLVRLRDEYGVSVCLYWKCRWEPGRSTDEINWMALTHQAASHLFHNGVPVKQIFGNKRLPLWHKEAKSYGHFESVPFTGGLGERKKAELVAWVKELEENLPAFQATAAAAVKTWMAWGSQLKSSVADRSLRVQIHSFNANSQQASIVIPGALTQAQIEAIADVLKPAAIQ